MEGRWSIRIWSLEAQWCCQFVLGTREQQEKLVGFRDFWEVMFQTQLLLLNFTLLMSICVLLFLTSSLYALRNSSLSGCRGRVGPSPSAWIVSNSIMHGVVRSSLPHQVLLLFLVTSAFFWQSVLHRVLISTTQEGFVSSQNQLSSTLVESVGSLYTDHPCTPFCHYSSHSRTPCPHRVLMPWCFCLLLSFKFSSHSTADLGSLSV